VVEPAIVRTVLSLALTRSWPVHQLDVKNAFLHSTLTKTVYYTQPAGFVDSSRPNMVCRLNKSLYGLKQAPRTWYSWFAAFILTLGFVEAKSDTSLFIYHHEILSSQPPVRHYFAASSPLFSRNLLWRILVWSTTSSGSLLSLVPPGYFSTSGNTLLISWSELGWLTASLAPLWLTHRASCQRPRAPQWQIPLHTGVLPVHFSTSPSPGRTSPMQFSRFVHTCMIPESHTSLL